MERPENVKDIMTGNVVSVSPGDRVADAVIKFVDNWIDGAPVVDADNMVVGIVTDGDLLRAFTSIALDSLGGGDPFQLAELLDDAEGQMESSLNELASQAVGNLMSADVITVDGDAPITEAARIMTENGLKTLPVIHNGRLVGMLSRSDIVLSILARRSFDLYRSY